MLTKWVPTNHPIFLFLGNAGGHGTQYVVDAYVKGLEDDFTVICIYQHPCLPATNILAFGVWVAFQNVMEKLHFSSIWR